MLTSLGLSLLVCLILNSIQGRPGVQSQLSLSVFASATLVLLVGLTARPIFSTLIIIALLLLLFFIDKTKREVLREPLVATDLLMYSQVFRYPRLYLPFVPIRRVVVVALLILMIVVSGLVLESPISFNQLLLVLISSILYAIAWYITPNISYDLDIQDGIEQYGSIGYLLAHFKGLFKKINREQFASVVTKDALENETLDVCEFDIVVIQSESFFDFRRLIEPQNDLAFMSAFDRFADEASFNGQLEVPAWGANTLRTEFSFLTGVKNEDLGIYRYYPYYFLQKIKVKTIASKLKEQGYQTILIHPYEKGFFKREQIYRCLGFDQFIGIEGFRDDEKVGAYIGDVYLVDRVRETLNACDMPCFIYVITMENHGPLHLEKLKDDEFNYYQQLFPELGSRDLAIYLRHIDNADRMLERLRHLLCDKSRERCLSFYGDHLPPLGKIFEQYSFLDQRTDYFVWNSRSGGSTKRMSRAVEDLSGLIIKSVNCLKKTP